MKKEGFTIQFQGANVNVEPVYLEDLLHYKVKLPEGEKFLRLEEQEGNKLLWTLRGEGHTPEAEILGNLVGSKVM